MTGKRIVMGVVGVLGGIVAGSVGMMALHMASTIVWPLPEGVDMMSADPKNQERMVAWIATLPPGAFVAALAAHGLGCMVGAIVAMLVSGRRSLMPAWIIGLFFTVGGVMNLQQIPHPSWFAYVDLPIYLVLALVAGVLLRREPAGADVAPAAANG